MKQLEKFRVYDDTDLDDEIWPKPLVKLNVIRLAVFCVVLVIFLAGVVCKIANG